MQVVSILVNVMTVIFDWHNLPSDQVTYRSHYFVLVIAQEKQLRNCTIFLFFFSFQKYRENEIANVNFIIIFVTATQSFKIKIKRNQFEKSTEKKVKSK